MKFNETLCRGNYILRSFERVLDGVDMGFGG